MNKHWFQRYSKSSHEDGGSRFHIGSTMTHVSRCHPKRSATVVPSRGTVVQAAAASARRVPSESYPQAKFRFS
jgi:hypothetical protein